MVDYLYLFLYKIFAFIVQIIPQTLLDRLLKSLASLLFRLSTKYQKVISTNLHIAFPDITEEAITRIGKRTYLNFLHNISGFIRRQNMQQQEIIKNITYVNDATLLQAIKEQKNIIFITAHYGNWELVSTALTSQYNIPMSVVGKPLPSKVMQNILKENREQFDIKLINKKGAMKQMIKALSEKRSIGLLVDHHTTINEGVIINFFAKEATQTMSPAMLARKFDAILFPVFISSEDFHHHTVTFLDAIQAQKTDNSKEDIQTMTQKQANAIEKAIKTKPDEWFWLHRRWKYCCKNDY